MRTSGVSLLLKWRWTPLLALLLGSVGFVAVVLLVVPDEIGGAARPSPTPGLRDPEPATTPRVRAGAANEPASAPVATARLRSEAAYPRTSAPSAPLAAADPSEDRPLPAPEAAPPPVPVSTITGNADDYPIGPKND